MPDPEAAARLVAAGLSNSDLDHVVVGGHDQLQARIDALIWPEEST